LLKKQAIKLETNKLREKNNPRINEFLKKFIDKKIISVEDYLKDSKKIFIKDLEEFESDLFPSYSTNTVIYKSGTAILNSKSK
jgi:hypothetical protein